MNVDALRVGYILSLCVALVSSLGFVLFRGRKAGARFLAARSTTLDRATPGAVSRIGGTIVADEIIPTADGRAAVWVRTTRVREGTLEILGSEVARVPFSLDDGIGRAAIRTPHVDVIASVALGPTLGGVRTMELALLPGTRVEVLGRVERDLSSIRIEGSEEEPVVVVEQGAHHEEAAQARAFRKIAWIFGVSATLTATFAILALITRADADTIASIVVPPVVIVGIAWAFWWWATRRTE